MSNAASVPLESRPCRIFISTGEVSGDLQGALLVEALQRQAAQRGFELEILALGGDRMAKAGAVLLGNTSAIGSVGILETLPFVLPTIQIQQRVKRHLRAHPPNLVVMIDYLGPNLGIGSYVRRYLPHLPTVYFITPQDWVWSVSQRNTRRIIRVSDRLLAIFPAEARYYQERGASVTWVGHPLVDRVQTFPNREQARAILGIPSEQVAIALLPASRHQELKYLLPVIAEAARRLQTKLPQSHFWIPLSLEALRPRLEQAIQQYGLRATIVADQPQAAIAAADLAISKSGSANLEIALLQVPQVVLYRVSPITGWIARHLLNFSIPFMSPPNLMLMEAIVPEFLQEQATPENLTQAALELLLNPDRKQQMILDYARMRQVAGEVGVCDRAAQEILNLL
jgi:lipid-A-disaccharide synthase